VAALTVGRGLQAVEDRESGVNPRLFAGCVVVEHQATDDCKGQGGLGLGGDFVRAGSSQQLRELREPVMDARTAKSWKPVGLGLSECVDLVKEPEEGTVDGIGDDRAQRPDEAAEIPRVTLSKLRTAGIEQLATSIGEGGRDERVAGSEVVDEHPRACLKSVREVPEGNLAALTSDEQFCRLSLQTVSTPLVTRSTRCCNVVTGTVG
jgi:hypothetical protein